MLNWLQEPFEANYIRIHPIQWSVGVCLRFEIYGCVVSNQVGCACVCVSVRVCICVCMCVCE